MAPRRTVYDTAADKAQKEIKDGEAKIEKAQSLVKRLLKRREELVNVLETLEPLVGRRLIDPKKIKRGPAKNNSEAIDRVVERLGPVTIRKVADEAIKQKLFVDTADDKVYGKVRSIMTRRLDDGAYRRLPGGDGRYDLASRTMEWK